MAKKWSELKVGDILIAIDNGMHVTKGRTYEVESAYGDSVDFINDEGRHHTATEEWVLKPYEENEKGSDKRAKFKVGDKVRIINELYGHQFEIGEVVAITAIDLDDPLCPYSTDDEWWVGDAEIEAVEETPKKANGILNVEVNVDALHTTPNVYPGQVRMSTDGFVILVIHAIFGLDDGETEGYFNSIILHDPLDNELDFECNLPVRNQSGDDIADEYPIVVDAKLTIDKVNGGNV